MATVKIKGRKEEIKIDRILAEELKARWLVAIQINKLDEVVDIVDWCGPWRKVDSIDLSTRPEENKIIHRLDKRYSSYCCNTNILILDGANTICEGCREPVKDYKTQLWN